MWWEIQFLSSGDGYLGKLLEFPKTCQVHFRVPRGKGGFLWKHCIVQGPPEACRGELRGLRGVVPESLGFLSSCVLTCGTRSCLLREVRSPLAMRGATRDSLCIAAGMNRASVELRREPQGSSPFLTSISGSLQSWIREVRPRLVLRHGTPLASRVVHGVSGYFSSCIWNLRLFLEDFTRVSVPLCVVTPSSGLHLKRHPINWT